MKPFVALPLALVLAGVTGLLWGADPAAGKVKLEGTWVAVEVVEGGKTDERIKTMSLKLILKDDKYVYQVNETKFTAKFKADATVQPNSMDVVFEEGPAKGKNMLAIYSLEGDELQVCVGNQKRPTEFVGTAETVLFKFKREKP